MVIRKDKKARRREWIIIIPIWILLLIIIIGLANWGIQTSQCKDTCEYYGYAFEKRASYHKCLCTNETGHWHFVNRTITGTLNISHEALSVMCAGNGSEDLGGNCNGIW